MRSSSPGKLRRAALYAVVLGALALSWAGQSSTVAPLLGPAMAIVFAGVMDLGAVIALHEVTTNGRPQVRGWAWAVLILSGSTSLGLNIFHAVRAGLLPLLVSVTVGAVPVLLAVLLCHVDALCAAAAAAPWPAPEPVDDAPTEAGRDASGDAPCEAGCDAPAEAVADALGEAPAPPAREPLRVVGEARRQARPAAAERGPRGTVRAPASGPDPDVRMAEYWRIETAAGRVPTGGELARVGGVSRATGVRRAGEWREQLGQQGEPDGGAEAQA